MMARSSATQWMALCARRAQRSPFLQTARREKSPGLPDQIRQVMPRNRRGMAITKFLQYWSAAGRVQLREDIFEKIHLLA